MGAGEVGLNLSFRDLMHGIGTIVHTVLAS